MKTLVPGGSAGMLYKFSPTTVRAYAAGHTIVKYIKVYTAAAGAVTTRQSTGEREQVPWFWLWCG